MPESNRFRHQQYPTTPALRPVFREVSADQHAGTQFGRLHTAHSIQRVILVHGTFMGNDPIGIGEILRHVGSKATVVKPVFDGLADKLGQVTKPVSDSLHRDIANYTPGFGKRFSELVGGDPTVELLSPTWSSQNHHVARADLAVRLLVQLHKYIQQPDQRVLLWGHSHAGNAFALLSNLLANDRAAVARFFDAARQPFPHWQVAKELLVRTTGPHPLAQAIDIVAFGTPVRYGWDNNGYRTLTHVLHHNKGNNAGVAAIRTKPLFPPHNPVETLAAKHGDWVQAFAIAGTDVPTGTSLNAHKRLDQFLTSELEPPQHGVDTRFIVPEHLRDACARWKTGTRCHADGLNLLLEYKPCGRRTRLGRPIEQSILGHGVATTIDWLPTHLSLILESLDAQTNE